MCRQCGNPHIMKGDRLAKVPGLGWASIDCIKRTRAERQKLKADMTPEQQALWTQAALAAFSGLMARDTEFSGDGSGIKFVVPAAVECFHAADEFMNSYRQQTNARVSSDTSIDGGDDAAADGTDDEI
jgi:hypothetical protein